LYQAQMHGLVPAGRDQPLGIVALADRWA